MMTDMQARSRQPWAEGASRERVARPARKPTSDNRCDPREPASYPRRVLLCITGLSPQVVTETVYALAIAGRPRFVPTEVRLLTTVGGAEHARLDLLSAEPGWFRRLCREYGLDGIAFEEGHIQVLADPRGRPLADIRTLEDNAHAADCITAVVRELTGHEDAALHVSVAGGRKTMGLYAGYALSLYGRAQDRLSHVLVSPPFESHPEFYYPSRGQRVIHTLDAEKRPIDCQSAEVTLAEIPFVRLRHGLDGRLLTGEARFSEVVACAQRALEPPRLVIDLDERCIYAGDARVTMPGAPLAFLSWLARRAVAGQPPVVCPAAGTADPDYAQEFLREYDHVGDAERRGTARRLRKGMTEDFFRETLSRLRRRLKAALGPAGAERYGVQVLRQRQCRYVLAVPPPHVEWRGGV